MVKRIIRKLTISEISAVDKPAQEHSRGLIMKRAAETEGDVPQDFVRPLAAQHIGPEHARLHSLATDAVRATPGLSYARAVANVFESNASFRERVKREHLAHVMTNAGQQQGTRKMIDFAKMAPSADAVAFEKRYNAGDFDHLTKAEWHSFIEKAADLIRADGESQQQAYTRLITADTAGRLMFKAFQNVEHRAPVFG